VKQSIREYIAVTLFALLSFVAKGQTCYDYFYLEAEKCRLADDYSSAMALYQHCVDINANRPEALYNLGLIYSYLRNDSVSTTLLKRACELDPKNPWYLEALASLYLNRRNTEEVIPVLEQMATLQSRRSDVLAQLASIYRTNGDTDKAIDVLNRIELLEGKSTQLALEKYSLYMSKEQKDSAFMELQTLCDEFPHDMNSRVVVGNQYQQAGEFEKAMALFDEVRQKDPANVNLQLATLAYYKETKQQERYSQLRDSLLFASDYSTDFQVALMRGYIDEAQTDSTLQNEMQQTFDSLLSLPQKDAQMLTLKAAYQIYCKVSEDDIAKTMVRILEVEPGNQIAMSHLLQYYASKNRVVELEDICRKGVNYHPEELAYYYYLGLTLYQQDKNKEAAEMFMQGLQTKSEDANPKLVSDMYAVLGDLYHQEEREAEAFAAYDSALVYVDDNISCLNNYAYYLSLQNERLDEAEEMSYRTIKAEPKNITYLDTYAWILFMKKDYTNARIYIDRVIAPETTDDELLESDNLQANLIEHAGDIYIQCGEVEKALRYWKLALAKDDGTCTATLKKKIKQKRYVK